MLLPQQSLQICRWCLDTKIWSYHLEITQWTLRLSDPIWETNQICLLSQYSLCWHMINSLKKTSQVWIFSSKFSDKWQLRDGFLFVLPLTLVSYVCVPADQPQWGGGSSVSAALHLQTGADRCGSQSGETLELLRLPGHQEHIDSAGDTPGTWKRRQAEDEATRGHCRDVKDTVQSPLISKMVDWPYKDAEDWARIKEECYARISGTLCGWQGRQEAAFSVVTGMLTPNLGQSSWALNSQCLCVCKIFLNIMTLWESQKCTDYYSHWIIM